MIKRLVSLILILSLMTIAFGCSKSASEQAGVIRPDSNDEKPEITILVNAWEIDILRNSAFLGDYKRQFEKKFGVRVNYKEIGDKKPAEIGQESYRKELATILHVKEGPELIYYTGIPIVNPMIEQGAAADLRGKVTNLAKVYDKLLNEKVYYLPIEMRLWPRLLNKKVISELGIEVSGSNWSKKDYYEIRKKWLEQGSRMFGRREYYDTAEQYLYDIKLLDTDNKKVTLNTAEMRDRIRKIRNETFSGKYVLNPTFTYEDYYKMFFDNSPNLYTSSQNPILSSEYTAQCLDDKDASSGVDLFRANYIHKLLEKDIVMPGFNDEDQYVYTYGFLVNKNGKNQELAYEFLNGLLSDEVQMQIYMDDKYALYPVNKDLEDEIRKIEMSSQLDKRAIELKDYALNELNNGRCKLLATADTTEEDLMFMLRKDIFQFVFADKEYSDAELSKELQKLEDKYNIYLSE